MRWLALSALMLQLLAGTAAAAGLGVSPGSIAFDIAAGLQQPRQMVIYNNGDELLHYTLETSTEWLDFFPAEGVIAPGSAQMVLATARIPEAAKVGAYRHTIRIRAKNSATGVRIETGVVMNAGITVRKQPGPDVIAGAMISASIIGSGLLVYGAVTRKRTLPANGKSG